MKNSNNYFILVGQSILIGVFILGLLTFVLGFGVGRNRNMNPLVIGTGFIIIFPYLIYFLILYFKFKKEKTVENNNIELLKKTGEKLIVNLETIEIKKTRISYYSKIINNTVRTGAYNQITGKPNENIRTKKYSTNEVNFKIPYGNNFIKIKKFIDMEPETLMLHFAVKKTTYLYVDKTNMRNYHLDLEFLN